MTDYIYKKSGEPIGFIRGDYVYSLGGQPIGQLRDGAVYRLSGGYIGELYEKMIVDRGRNRGNVGSSGNPGSPGSPAAREIEVPAAAATQTCPIGSLENDALNGPPRPFPGPHKAAHGRTRARPHHHPSAANGRPRGSPGAPRSHPSKTVRKPLGFPGLRRASIG
jgi:hypothetical protein